ncbi:MAG: pilus assembly protein TadG-related protein [Frankiaceae bacterium]
MFRKETGAVAVIVALFMVVLVASAALVLDLAVAYKNKQQAQAAADAGALAAAVVYKAQLGTCANLVGDTALKTTARTEADKVRDADLTGVDPSLSTLTASCNAAGGLVVDYSVGKNSPVGLGRLIYNSDHITVSRSSEATLAPVVGGMRPWAICSNVVNTSETVTFVPTKGGAVANKDPKGAYPCGTTGPPGGWWIEQCTGQGNGTGDTDHAVSVGCPTSGYQSVPGQTTSMTPTQLRSFLVGVCPSKTFNDTCLGSDPGNNFGHAASAWQTLVGQSITMPVLCFPPQCMSSPAVDGGGNNASYAIMQIATVQICGFNIGGTKSTGWPTTGPCATNNPLNYSPDDVTAGDGLFLVIRRLDGGATPWVGDPPPPTLQLTK